MIRNVVVVNGIPRGAIFAPELKHGQFVGVRVITRTENLMKKLMVRNDIRVMIPPDGFVAVGPDTVKDLNLDMSLRHDIIHLKPQTKTRHRYGIIYRDTINKKYICVNVINPEYINYFSMIWNRDHIPKGLDSVITRMEDGTGHGCIWDSRRMVIDMDCLNINVDKINDIVRQNWDNNNQYTFEYAGKYFNTEMIINDFEETVENTDDTEHQTNDDNNKYFIINNQKYPLIVDHKFNHEKIKELMIENNLKYVKASGIYKSDDKGMQFRLCGELSYTDDTIQIFQPMYFSLMSFTVDFVENMKSFEMSAYSSWRFK